MAWRPDFDPHNLYFITTKAEGYAHLFQRDVVKRILLDTFDCLRARSWVKLYSFVIMPNHTHCVAQFTAERTLADFVRDFKHHTADRVVRQWRAEADQNILESVAKKAGRTGKQNYKVWEDGYNVKEVITEPFLLQKMTYIHNNPCQPHWNLAPSPECYPWSSARFYLTDEPCIIPIDDARKLLG